MSSKKKSEIGLMVREALDTEVTRIAQGKLHSRWCDPAGPSVVDGLTRFVIRVQGGEIRIQSRLEFLPSFNWSTEKDGGLTYDPEP